MGLCDRALVEAHQKEMGSSDKLDFPGPLQIALSHGPLDQICLSVFLFLRLCLDQKDLMRETKCKAAF